MNYVYVIVETIAIVEFISFKVGNEGYNNQITDWLSNQQLIAVKVGFLNIHLSYAEKFNVGHLFDKPSVDTKIVNFQVLKSSQQNVQKAITIIQGTVAALRWLLLLSNQLMLNYYNEEVCTGANAGMTQVKVVTITHISLSVS